MKLNQFLLDEAEYSTTDDSETAPEATASDIEFIDDDDLQEFVDPFKIESEHRKNLKRIAKNLDEFEDSLSFNYTDRESLKAFLMLL